MAVAGFDDATSPAEQSGSTQAGTHNDARHQTTVRLLVGAGVAIGFAAFLPWVRYTGLIQTETEPGAGAVLIGLLFAALLIVAGMRTSRSACSAKLAFAAGAASVLSAFTAVFVVLGCRAHSSALATAQPGLGIYVLFAGAGAGIIALARSYRGNSQGGATG